jgi:hypothetical protein
VLLRMHAPAAAGVHLRLRRRSADNAQPFQWFWRGVVSRSGLLSCYLSVCRCSFVPRIVVTIIGPVTRAIGAPRLAKAPRTRPSVQVASRCPYATLPSARP